MARAKFEQKRKRGNKGGRNKSGPGPIKDLRQILKKKDNRRGPNRNQTPSNSRVNKRNNRPSINNRPANNNNNNKQRQQPTNKAQPTKQMHVQPPTYVIAPPSSMAMDKIEPMQSASVLVSNLLPSITQSDIIELYGDVGPITSVNMINQTTALVCYQHSSDAVNAVKVYHNRLLDGKPMIVNMMPITPAPMHTGPTIRNRLAGSGSVRSSAGIFASRRG